jgi:hypothetical protein
MALIPMAIAFRLIYFLVSFLNERTVSRKAAATASWWPFFIALISAFASAGGGALGVII